MPIVESFYINFINMIYDVSKKNSQRDTYVYRFTRKIGHNRYAAMAYLIISRNYRRRFFANAVFLNKRKCRKIHYNRKRDVAENDFIIIESTVEARVHGVIQDLRKVEKILSNPGMKECYVIINLYNGQDGFIPAPLLWLNVAVSISPF